jgi:carboxymethylenebutenolidase
MGTNIDIVANDGFSFRGYVAEPAGKPKGAMIVIQEIFGVNSHIESVADGYAADGYLAIAPALFDRIERGVALGYTGDDMKRGVELARTRTDFQRAVADVLDAAGVARERLAAAGVEGGKVACVGYCWGGVVSTAVSVSGSAAFDAAICYYGTGAVGFVEKPLTMPLQMHFGDQDASIPAEHIENMRTSWPTAEIYVYEGHHGFNCDQRPQGDKALADLALSRVHTFLDASFA